jgi:hypothetical protein
VRVRHDTEVGEAVEALGLDGFIKRCQGFKPGAQVKGAILIVGDSTFLDDHLSKARELERERAATGKLSDVNTSASVEIESRLKMVFSRGIAIAAMSKCAVVITAGVDKGPIGYMGRANADRNHQFPMLGVVPEGSVTWNGDLRPATDMRSRLQPDHTHLVMLECNSFDDATAYRFKVAEHIIRPVPGQRDHKLPAVAICVSGDESDLEQVLQSVRKGWPVVIMKGSGGIADALAWAGNPENRGTFVPNPAIMEIVRDGTIETVDISTADGKVTSAMLERLFDTIVVEHKSQKKNIDAKARAPPRSHNCQLMWDQILLYKHNATRMAARAGWLQSAILWLNVLLTALVVVKMFSQSAKAPDEMRSSDTMLGVFNLAVVLLPIFISVFIAVVNYFQFNLKADILHAAADYMTSQVYSYRGGGGNAAKNEQQLGVVLGHMTEAVVSTQVGSMSLVECSGDGETAVRNALGMHENDDAISTLSPEQYIRYRLGLQLAAVGGSTGVLGAENMRLRFLIFLMGGTATVLAVFKYTIFIALTTALTTTFAAIIETNNYVPRIVARNRCCQDLSSLKAWWHSLTPIEQANPVKCSELVRRVENAIMAEVKFSNPAAAMLVDTSPGYATFDVNGLIGDIAQNLTRGGKKPFRFASTWMDKYKSFFEAYHNWYAAKHQKRLKTGSLSVLMNQSNAAMRPGSQSHASIVVDSHGEDLLAGLSAAQDNAAAAAGATPAKGAAAAHAARGAAPRLHSDDYGGGDAADMAADDAVRSMTDDDDTPAGGALALFDMAAGREAAPGGVGMKPVAAVSPIEVIEILWDPDEFLLRKSRCISVNALVGSKTLAQVHRSLKLGEYYKETTGGDGGVKGAICIIGMSARLDDFMKNAHDDVSQLPDQISPQEGITRLQMVFCRGVITAARASQAVIFSSGIDVGPCAFVGAANRAHSHAVPVIGVVNRSKVTWPGDERAGYERRTPLQPDHTHFVTLGADDNLSCTRFTFELMRAVTDNRKLPSIAMVVNGGVNAMAAVLTAVRDGLPIVVIRGTGGLADLLSQAKADPIAFISDNDITEIVQDGHIEFFEISEVDGSIVNEMLLRLFGHSDDTPDGGKHGNRTKTVDYSGRGGVPKSQYNKVAPYGLPEDAEGVGFNTVVPGGGRDEEAGMRGGPGRGGGEGRSLARHLNNVIASWAKVLSLRDKAGACKSVAGNIKMGLLGLGVLMTFVASLLHFVEQNVAVEELARFAPAPPPPVAADGVSLETLNTYHTLPSWLSSPTSRKGMMLALLILPIVAGIITSVDNELGYGMKAALLSSAAESIKSEIFKYRTCVGEYSNSFYARNGLLGTHIDALYDALMSTGVGELGGFTERTEINGPGVVARVAQTEEAFAPDDDYYSQLTPEDYVTHRLESLKRKYTKVAAHAETWEHRLNVPLYLLQGVSMGFALVDRYQVFVAVSTALTSAVVAVKESSKCADKLFVYNRSLAALTGILTWWRSLSAIEKANPQKFAKLVEDVEGIKRVEIQSLAPPSEEGGQGGVNGGASEYFQPAQFKQDVVDNIDADSQLHFKMSWIERHPFFTAYQDWMDEQGMWEDRRDRLEGEPTLPPLGGNAVGLPFLEDNLVDLYKLN